MVRHHRVPPSETESKNYKDCISEPEILFICPIDFVQNCDFFFLLLIAFFRISKISINLYTYTKITKIFVTLIIFC